MSFQIKLCQRYGGIFSEDRLAFGEKYEYDYQKYAILHFYSISLFKNTGFCDKISSLPTG